VHELQHELHGSGEAEKDSFKLDLLVHPHVQGFAAEEAAALERGGRYGAVCSVHLVPSQYR
jgi:hypothetical protein